jgi:riboflavin biosynthesis pyrimidine reductase
MRRLFPYQADEVTVEEAYSDPIRRRHRDAAPWVALCMVASIDGATAVEGRSRGLGSPADTAVLLGLRQLADVIVVGAATVRAEQYGPPSTAGQRIGVVSSAGAGLDTGSTLFSSGSGFVITAESAPPLPIDTVRAGHGRVDLRKALQLLDVDFVQGEGGARLNGSLFDADLVDEINVTISPNIVGGDSARVVSGAASALRRFTLRHVLEEDGFLFNRYVRNSASSAG